MGAHRVLVVSALSLLSGVAVACGDDAAGPSPSEITGTWQATKVEYASTAQPTVSVDPIEDDDSSVTLVLAAKGSYTPTQTPPGEPPQTSTGTPGIWTATSSTWRRPERSPASSSISHSAATL